MTKRVKAIIWLYDDDTFTHEVVLVPEPKPQTPGIFELLVLNMKSRLQRGISYKPQSSNGSDGA